MQPTLFVPFIHSYGVMLAVGFYAAWWLAARRARAEDIHPDVIGNLVLISIIAGVVGARLVWFALYRDPGDSWLVLIQVWKGGLVFYGGLIAAAIADLIYLRKAGLYPWRVADVVAPAVALGQAFGRIGCFLNGCCFGGLASEAFPLAVRFPGAPTGSLAFADHVARYPLALAQSTGVPLTPEVIADPRALAKLAETAPLSLPVHPTQLYESAALFLIAALAIAATPHKRRHGEVFALVCILNAISRLGVELVRRDTMPVALGLNPGQLGALAVLGIGLALFAWARLRGKS